MTTDALIFRSTYGVSDAAVMAEVQQSRRGTDRILSGLRFEECPDEAQLREELHHSETDDWIIAVRAGVVVGYGHTMHSWTERDGTRVYLHLGWIKPEWRSYGIGRELLYRLETRCREKAKRDGYTGRIELAANASGSEESAQHLLRHAGYTPLYTMMEMEYPSHQEVVPYSLTKGYELRPAVPEHYRAIWQMIGDAYYVMGVPCAGVEVATEDDYNRYFHSDSADPALWFVAWEQSRIAGVVLCRIENGGAEIYEVSVAHAHRGKGLAKALITQAITKLRQRGVSPIRLVTKRENPSEAWRLYETIGFRTVKDFPRWRKRIPE